MSLRPHLFIAQFMDLWIDLMKGTLLISIGSFHTLILIIDVIKKYLITPIKFDRKETLFLV